MIPHNEGLFQKTPIPRGCLLALAETGKPLPAQAAVRGRLARPYAQPLLHAQAQLLGALASVSPPCGAMVAAITCYVYRFALRAILEWGSGPHGLSRRGSTTTPFSCKSCTMRSRGKDPPHLREHDKRPPSQVHCLTTWRFRRTLQRPQQRQLDAVQAHGQ